MNKKLLFISQYFDPETFRGNDIAYFLASIGYDVTVITGTPNYPKGSFFKGYGWFKRNIEIKHGVKIIRVPIIPRGKSSIQLIINYFSYAIVASFFLLFHLIRNKYDKCFVQQLSPVMMSLPGIIFKKITKKTFFLWVLDLWPESLQSAGGINNKYVLNFFKIFVKSQYRNADYILVSSKDFSKSVFQYGDYTKKIIYFPQWADGINDVQEAYNPQNLPTFPDSFNVVFTGNVGEAQDFVHIIEAVKLLKDDENIKIIIIGDGRKESWVKEQIEKYGLQDRILMLGRYPSEYMPYFTNKADVLFACLKDEPIFGLTVPAKIQTYMSAGKPIIVMMNGAGHNLIKEVGCGIAVDAENPDKFIEAVRKLKNLSENERVKMGEKAKSYYEENFEKYKCLNNLLNIINTRV